MTKTTMPIRQVALSVVDLQRTMRWYQETLLFGDGGGTDMFRGDHYAALVGVPGAATQCGWVVDQLDGFQWEFFQFLPPTQVRPLPADKAVNDIGYSLIAIHTTDFDAAVERVNATSGRFLTEPVGEPGRRRICLKDPDGVLLELMEDDPRKPGAPERVRTGLSVVTRGVRVSTPDVERSRSFFVDVLGFEVADVELHGDEHEALWGLDGAKTKRVNLWGGDFLVELVQYESPIGRRRPAGYHISDQGIENIAIGGTRREHLYDVWERVHAAGHRGFRPEPWDLGFAGVIYVNDDQGFNVEMFWLREEAQHTVGFELLDPDLNNSAWPKGLSG
jgi:catechol 2,3-dioxygenase-like lactoylglutathione lyase family enzyme